jgi:hypothetical protein
MQSRMRRTMRGLTAAFCFAAITAGGTQAQSLAEKKILWKPVPFAIVRYNDEAPASWNLYHAEKSGLLLLRLWKRYLLIDRAEQEVYDIDPQKVTPHGDNFEWSQADKPDEPIEVSEWKQRDVGSMQRVRFRFGKTGHFLELQLPMLPNGKPAY